MLITICQCLPITAIFVFLLIINEPFRRFFRGLFKAIVGLSALALVVWLAWLWLRWVIPAVPSTLWWILTAALIFGQVLRFELARFRH